MNLFGARQKQLLSFLTANAERETLDYVLQGMKEVLGDEMPVEDAVRAYLQDPDEPISLSTEQQIVALDKLLECAEVNLRTLCDLIRYLDYLSANDAGLFLPTSIKSYLDGRLGQLEERLSSLAFRQAVEQDMVAGILADAYQFSDEDLRCRRSESVQNVKKTNGRVSLEQRVRGAWEEDDEWQD